MKKTFKSIAVFMLIAVLSLTCVMSCAAVALPEVTAALPAFAAETAPEIVVSGSAMSIRILETTQLKAELKGTTEAPEIKWESSDEEVATVNSKGKVTGRGVGRAMITAYAEIGGKRIEGKYNINVTTGRNLLKSFLEKNAVLSYQYSYVDDYYYAND